MESALGNSGRLRKALSAFHDAQDVASPQSGKILLGIAATQQFQGDVEGFRGMVPTHHTATSTEV